MTRSVRVAMGGFLAGACALMTSAIIAQAQPPVTLQSDFNAEVEKDRIIIYMPEPYDRMVVPKTPVVGYFVWRISVETQQPFSLVVTSDTALRAIKVADVLRASTVRLCADPATESARDCRTPTNTTIEPELNFFRVIIRDPELIARVRRERPMFYRFYMVEPGGHFLTWQRPFAYKPDRR